MRYIELKRRSLYQSKSYFILDIDTLLYPPLYIIKKLSDTKAVDIIQLRDKSSIKSKIVALAKSIRMLLKKNKILFIINDYIDIVKSVDADGLHLGQNDLPLPLARRILGKEKIIGISCHSLEEAEEAEREGADYISIGPIFTTPLKPEYHPLGVGILKKIKNKINIPYFPVGGIDLSNMNRLISLGINRVAFSRLLGRARDLDYIIEELNRKFQ